MPFRSVAPPAARCLLRPFHASAAGSYTHYDTLKVSQNASAKDIKKSFYSLSKTHHPDHNPDDPEAPKRFMQISEAYAMIGNPEKRQRYDRDVLRTASHGNVAPRGSHFSSGPAGGRSASGLSRRRTHFQGPPPSFYRSGGYGDQSNKRHAAQEGTNPDNSRSGDWTKGTSGAGGMGYGQSPFGSSDDVPHFDREGHFRTHSNQEKRRQSKILRDDIPVETGKGTLGSFMFISSILALGIVLPGFIIEHLTRSERKREK